MRKKLFVVLTAGLLAGVMLAGCSKNKEKEVVPVPSVEELPQQTPEASEPTPEGFPTVSEREVVDGKVQSYLTGEWKDEIGRAHV